MPSELLLDLFKDAVRSGDPQRLDDLLTSQVELREVLDDPLFDFDAPAVVKAKTNLPLLDVLLTHGADINARSHWWAGSYGVLDETDPAIAEELIRRGAKLDPCSAAGLGKLDVLTEMVAADPEAVNARGGDGWTPLHFARSLEVVDWLLDHDAAIDVPDNDHHGTAAQWAINDLPKLRRLLEAGAEPDIFMACVLADVDLARRCIDEDPDCLGLRLEQEPYVAPGGHAYVYRLDYTSRPLVMAMESGNKRFYSYLYGHGYPDDHLVLGLWLGDRELAQNMLDGEFELMELLGPRDQALICDAAWANRPQAIELMLEMGFDVNTQDLHQSTALDRAATCGHRELVELLLARGASVTVTNEYGGTPLRACLWGSMNLHRPNADWAGCVRALLQAGAEPPTGKAGNAECRAVLAEWQA